MLEKEYTVSSYGWALGPLWRHGRQACGGRSAGQTPVQKGSPALQPPPVTQSTGKPQTLMAEGYFSNNLKKWKWHSPYEHKM